METTEILDDLAEKYRLPLSQVHDALTAVLSGPVFRRATRSEFGELTEEGVVVFREDGFELLGQPKRPLSRVLTHELERILTDAATAQELEQLQGLRKQVIRARVRNITPDGAVIALLEMTGTIGETLQEIAGYCPRVKLSPQDRVTFKPDEMRFFYVERIEATRRGDAPATITIQLSRVTPYLTEYLLRRATQKYPVLLKCKKRVVGKVSYIEAQGFIPKAAILSVGKELGERIKVEVDRSKKAKAA